jgi:hypothetical protein
LGFERLATHRPSARQERLIARREAAKDRSTTAEAQHDDR